MPQSSGSGGNTGHSSHFLRPTIGEGLLCVCCFSMVGGALDGWVGVLSGGAIDAGGRGVCRGNQCG